MSRRTNMLCVTLGGTLAVAALLGQSLLGPSAAAGELQTSWVSSYSADLRGMGIRIQGPSPEGANMLAGVVRDVDTLIGAAQADEEILDLLGGIDRGVRIELHSPSALSRQEDLPPVYSDLDAPAGLWGLLLCKGRGTRALTDGPPDPEASAEQCRAWAAERGIELDPLTIISGSGCGKTTLLGTVDDVERLNATGLGVEGAAKGDRVHIIPQRRGGWKLALCQVSDSKLLLIDITAHTLVLP